MSDAATVATSLIGGGIAGLVAAVAMDVPMGRQPDGWTPAVIAAAVLTRTGPEDVSFEGASAVHHVTGVAAGMLYGIVTLTLAGVVPSLIWRGVPLVAHVLSVVIVTVFVYLVFAHGVLPRVGGTMYEERATAIRGQWLRSALVFAAALTIAGPLLLSLAATVLQTA